MPVGIGDSKTAATKRVVALGTFAEFSDVENSGGRRGTGYAFWPLSVLPIALKHAGVEICPVRRLVVGSKPLPVFVRVLARASRLETFARLSAIPAFGVPERGVLVHSKGALVAGIGPVGVWLACANEWTSLTPKDQAWGTSLPTFANHFVRFDLKGFDGGLRVVTLRQRVITVAAEFVVSIVGVLASCAVFHSPIGRGAGRFYTCMKKINYE
jgi:hypothetical protein